LNSKFEIWAKTQQKIRIISHFLEQQLLQHLGMSAVSPGKQQATQEKKRQQQREIRLQQIPEKQDAVRDKNKQEHREARLQQTPEKQDAVRDKNRQEHSEARANLTTSQQQEVRKKDRLAKSRARRKQIESLAKQDLHQHDHSEYTYTCLYIFIYSEAYIFQVDTSTDRAAPGTSDPLGMKLQECIPDRFPGGFSSLYRQKCDDGLATCHLISYGIGLRQRQQWCREDRAREGIPDCICESCGLPKVIYTYICECA
jgi:hypothetical protein